jgi:hypothetical protein
VYGQISYELLLSAILRIARRYSGTEREEQKTYHTRSVKMRVPGESDSTGRRRTEDLDSEGITMIKDDMKLMPAPVKTNPFVPVAVLL